MSCGRILVDRSKPRSVRPRAAASPRSPARNTLRVAGVDEWSLTPAQGRQELSKPLRQQPERQVVKAMNAISDAPIVKGTSVAETPIGAGISTKK
jgi:hypothetical protein